MSTIGVLDFAAHFEKMLYDSAQLAHVYLHAWQVTGESFYRTIAEEMLDYVVREMTCVGPTPDACGGFYSTQDVNSESEDGKFFVWTPGEFRGVLGHEGDRFIEAYGVTEYGNASAGSVLRVPPAIVLIRSSRWASLAPNPSASRYWKGGA